MREVQVKRQMQSARPTTGTASRPPPPPRRLPAQARRKSETPPSAGAAFLPSNAQPRAPNSTWG